MPPSTSGTTAPRSTTTAPATDPALDAAYAAGFVALCRQVWGHSSDGRLYDSQDPTETHVVSECLSQLDRSNRYSDTLVQARAEGRQDAIDVIFDLASSEVLCWVDSSQSFAGCFDASTGRFTPPPNG